MIGQVKVVGILMIVHGVTVILMGGFVAAVGPLILFAGAGGGGGPAPQDAIVISVIYALAGVMILTCGVLNTIAGYRVMHFRGRVFALVALFSNILVLVSCYCALTAVAMMAYGLIVLLHSDVARAFDLVAKGASPADMLGRLAPRYNDDRDDYDDEWHRPRRAWDDDHRRDRESAPDLDDDQHGR